LLGAYKQQQQQQLQQQQQQQQQDSDLPIFTTIHDRRVLQMLVRTKQVCFGHFRVTA